LSYSEQQNMDSTLLSSDFEASPRGSIDSFRIATKVPLAPASSIEGEIGEKSGLVGDSMAPPGTKTIKT
jgi:hypothetical protein